MRYSIFILTLILAWACRANAQQADAHAGKSLLWKISGKEMRKPSYLFGTIHLICKDDYFWTPAMKKSLAASEEVCMEMDMDDPSILMHIMSGMTETNGKQLPDYFTEEEYKMVEQYFRDSIGVNIAIFASMKPVILQTLLTTSASTCDSTVSYELQIVEMAKTLNKKISGLETPDEQIKLLDEIPVDSVVRDLVNIASGQSKQQAEFIAMVEAYKKQDLPALHNFILEAKQEGDYMDAFLDERNEKWIDRMTEYMDQNSVFFAVGAAHLWGEKGIISLLRQSGYQVTPVK